MSTEAAARFRIIAASALGAYLTWRVLLALGLPLARNSESAVDFSNEYWPAARNVLHGHSPFTGPSASVLATGFAFTYPAPAAILLAPFALLPVHVAAALFTVVLFACALLMLYLVDVRDPRCYVALFLWWPIQAAMQTANLTLLLCLGAALVWHFRNHRWLPGLTAGAFASLKLLLWPLVVWLLVTRRFAAAACAAATAAVLTAACWAVLGFAGLRDFVPTLRLLTRLEQGQSYSPLAVALWLGASTSAARAAGIAVAVAGVAAIVVLGLRRSDERASFVAALVASILASPVVWLHYFALIAVAIGLLRPRFDAVWLLPVLAFGPVRLAGPSWWALAMLALFAVVIAAPPPGSSRSFRQLLPRPAFAGQPDEPS